MVLEVEVLPAEMLLHPVGEAVRNIVWVETWEVQVPETHCVVGFS